MEKDQFLTFVILTKFGKKVLKISKYCLLTVLKKTALFSVKFC